MDKYNGDRAVPMDIYIFIPREMLFGTNESSETMGQMTWIPM